MQIRSPQPKGIMERLNSDVVLGDGGYIVELEQRGHVVTGAFTPEVSITHPEAIRELHYEMKNAGCEVLQVMAFYGSREKLSTVGFGDQTMEINKAATSIAREIAGNDLLVAGDLSTTWKWTENSADAEQLVSGMFDEQIEAQSGVDFFIGELFYNLGEALLCLKRIKTTSGLPAMITMSFRGNNLTEDGFTASDAAKHLHDAGADIVGLNCMNDPEHMYPHILEMRAAFDGYLAAQPVAFRCTDETPWFTGLPSFPDRLEPTQITRFELGEFATRAKDMGVNYIGGCCGCKATHMREMAKALGKYSADSRWNANPETPMSETEYNWERRQKSI
ncbi:MAG: homocysteine S-methyltransferase family protein [SAR202 cluster bacterium]|nr:homocysteine S-methyltransferase family protein [SAR202 cluster bacterium]